MKKLWLIIPLSLIWLIFFISRPLDIKFKEFEMYED
jgi:hypothetical protein